ncbi:MAG: DUF1611 domain-containing protein, partial [Pseudomonadota bacterium]
THMRGLPDYDLPTLEQVRDASLMLAKVVNPNAQVTGVAINTAALGDEEAARLCEETEARMGLPTVDPFRHGAGRLVDALV